MPTRQPLLISIMLLAYLSGCNWNDQKTTSSPVLSASLEEPAEQQSDPSESLEAALQHQGDVLDAAVLINEHYEDVGKYWMDVLNDEQRMIECRFEAADVLAKLRYQPAIAGLIKNIGLVNTELDPSLNRDETTLPIVDSLGQYGNAAVFPIIDAYLIEKTESNQLLLRAAIVKGSTQKVAMTYLNGLHAQRDKRVSDQVLADFQKLLIQ